MLLFLKWTSTMVHHYHHKQDQEDHDHDHTNYNIHDDQALCTSLTVWRKSLLFSCSGFTVIGSDGSLAYRVDNYTGRPDPIVLMDGLGNPIFTICRRKKLMLVDNYWLVYEGEMGKHCNKINKSSKKLPIFCVKKNLNIMRTKLNALAYVYSGSSDKTYTYMIEGSYTHRSCKIMDDSRRVLGEIKKKEAMTGGASFGLEVFHLMVKPGFDSRFAMAIVLLLDQMFS